MLEVMGKKSFFLGEDVGAGAKMKLVINMVSSK
jgi:3-hydroxyisobutyrate dehydrogenase-like beta-hydroxyacid dehydrogenase